MCYVYSDWLCSFRYLIPSIQFMLQLCSFTCISPQAFMPKLQKVSPAFEVYRGLCGLFLSSFATMKSRHSSTLTWSLGFVWVACCFSSRRCLSPPLLRRASLALLLLPTWEICTRAGGPWWTWNMSERDAIKPISFDTKVDALVLWSNTQSEMHKKRGWRAH